MKNSLRLSSCLLFSISTFSQTKVCQQDVHLVNNNIPVINCPDPKNDKTCVIDVKLLRCIEECKDPAAILVNPGQQITWQGGGKRFKILKFIETDCSDGTAKDSEDDAFDYPDDAGKFDSAPRMGKVKNDNKLNGRCFKHFVAVSKEKIIDPHVIIEPPGTALTPAKGIMSCSGTEGSPKLSKPKSAKPDSSALPH